MRPTPHGFQLDLANRVRSAYMAGKRIVVAQATTGAGKTTLACHITELALKKGRRVLLSAHRRRLVEQISGRLYDFELEHGVIMAGMEFDPDCRIQVASRDTLKSRFVNNCWYRLPPADLIIVDEAHHAADPESGYREILENYPNALILLLSATPVGPDGQGLGPWAEAIECAIPTTKLIEQGFLVPVKCIAPDRKHHHGKVKRRGIAGDLVSSWLQYAENLPTVLFCGRVAHSLDAVAAFKEAGIAAAHVDAETPDHIRDGIYEGLEDGTVKVVSNVGIIKEGVDVPCLGCCQLFMDMSGRVAFLQACGRIMRPYPGKTHGVLIDHAGAVFRHGFPDEDTDWPLDGNADEAYKKKHDNGETPEVAYCKICEQLFSGLACPTCGRMPSKPPRSIFAPPPVENTNEVLTEADRQAQPADTEDERIRHWYRCLASAFHRGGTFTQASAIYKKKYVVYPGDGFPHNPPWAQRRMKVRDVYPNFGQRRQLT